MEPQRGLIIPTVRKAWSLFKHRQLRHKSERLSDSWWQQNSIPLSEAGNGPCSAWPRGAPCHSGVAVLSVTHTAAQIPRMPSEMEPWLFPWTRGPPRGRAGAELQAGKVQNHRDFHCSTASTTCKHSLRHTRNRTYACLSCTHIHTQFRQVKNDMWAKLKSNLSCLELFRKWSVRGQTLPRFLHNGAFSCVTVFDSLRWSLMRTVVLVLAGAVPCINHLDQKEDLFFPLNGILRERQIEDRAAGAQWGCQSEKWGVNSGPVGSHMSSMRKQQFEE